MCVHGGGVWPHTQGNIGDGRPVLMHGVAGDPRGHGCATHPNPACHAMHDLPSASTPRHTHNTHVHPPPQFPMHAHACKRIVHTRAPVGVCCIPPLPCAMRARAGAQVRAPAHQGGRLVPPAQYRAPGHQAGEPAHLPQRYGGPWAGLARAAVALPCVAAATCCLGPSAHQPFPPRSPWGPCTLHTTHACVRATADAPQPSRAASGPDLALPPPSRACRPQPLAWAS